MTNHSNKDLRIFLCGDVMTGRGIDQILQHPSKPNIYESFLKDARDYISLAEKANGKINYPVANDYIWGAALKIWHEMQPDIKLINLECAITQNDDFWPGKGIQYRMHPANVGVLSTAGIDVCILANNHILDWSYVGLTETIGTLKSARIQFSGAGNNLTEALQPAIFPYNSNNRILIFAASLSSSGVPANWSARDHLPGVFYLPDFSSNTVNQIASLIKSYKQNHDLVIFSLHWGSNWGYEVSDHYRTFAHHLIDQAQVDVIFGHSSHHPRPIELYRGKPILYGCGDFFNDYEGISGYEEFRGDLSLMYFLDFDRKNLNFKKMTLFPLQIKKFSLHCANQTDSTWLLQSLNKCSSPIEFKMQNQKFVYIPTVF